MKIQNIHLYVTQPCNTQLKDFGNYAQEKNYLPDVTSNYTDSISFTGIKGKLPLLKHAREAEKKMFRPFKGPNNIKRLSAELQKKVKEIHIVTKDGIKLKCWDIAPKENMPYILYCHGLKKNLSMSSELLEGLSKEGFGVLGIEYRGYAGNAGVSSQKNHYKDTRAALEYLTKNKKIQRDNIIILGESLGGAISVDLAARCKNMMGLVVVSSLTKAKELAKHNFTQMADNNKVVNIALSPRVKKVFNKIPSALIPIENKYDSLNSITKVDYPILFVHSKPDTEIPYKMSVRMAQAARKNNPHVELEILKDGDHFTVNEKLHPIIEFARKLMNKSA